jgi:hypothetical protein
VRLPFPERISLVGTFVFALLLFAVQLWEGTNAIFSLCCFGFVLVAAVAFNVAGGLSRTTGAYVFFYSVLGVLIGLFWKAVLGEPADSNLKAPLATAAAYLGTICVLLVAVFISRKFATKRALLADFVTDANMQSATVGCMVTGLLILSAGTFGFGVWEPGSILSALNQIDRFLPLAIMLGVIHAIRRSGGTRSVSLPVLIAGTVIFIEGAISFSKQGMITPFLCWLIAAASQRYKVSLTQIAGGIFVVFFTFYYLVPYSQFGRSFKTGDSLAGNLDVAVDFFSNLSYVREQFLEGEAYQDEAVQGYFTTHQGFFDRLQMIGPDDTLIAYTQQTGPLGLFPVALAFENFVPHFIWRDKPVWFSGNYYAREAGILPDTDVTTGVSFSPTGEAFRLGGWLGIFIVTPILWIIMFTLFDSLCGDVRLSPWGLIIALSYAHSAPEGGISGVIYAIGFMTVAVLFAACLVTYLMPVVGQFIIGPNQNIIRPTNPIRSRPNRVRSLGTSENAAL